MATQPKNKIEVTREEWATAEQRWYELRHNGSYLDQTLSERQFGLYNQLEKGGVKSLNGTAVIILRDSSGAAYSDYCYRGMILNARMISNEYMLTVMYYASDNESWEGERVEEVRLFQIEQVQEVFLPIPEQLKDMKFLQIINVINRSRNQNLISLETRRKDYLNAVVAKERDIASYKRSVATLEVQIKAAQIPDLSKEEIIGFFRLLAKNKKVVNAYVNMAGEMVIETAMLYATTPVKLLENKKKPVGRFVFVLNTQGISRCKFANLDYCYHSGGDMTNGSHYPHPNLAGTNICSGNNSSMLDTMCRGGQFYELVDFLLLFFAMFPHDSGGPHVSHETWMASRNPEPKTNPFETEQRLWELYPGKKTDPPKKKEDYPESQLDELAKFAAGQTSQNLSMGQLRQHIVENLRENRLPDFFQNVTVPGGMLTVDNVLQQVRADVRNGHWQGQTFQSIQEEEIED